MVSNTAEENRYALDQMRDDSESKRHHPSDALDLEALVQAARSPQRS